MRVTPPSLPRSSVRRRGVLLGSGALLAAPAVVQAQGQTGVALVIGNSKYKWEASLPNAKRDATDVAKAFQALGLKTELVQDIGRDAMFAALEKFKAMVRAQGGKTDWIDDPSKFPHAKFIRKLPAPKRGYVHTIDAGDRTAGCPRHVNDINGRPRSHIHGRSDSANNTAVSGPNDFAHSRRRLVASRG